MLPQQLKNQSERPSGVIGLLESTSSGCSSGASPNFDTRRDAAASKRLAPSPPVLPYRASAVGPQVQQSLFYGTRLGLASDNSQLLMAAQHQQLYFQPPQAIGQRVNEGRLEGCLSVGAALGATSVATAACKQSSSSSFNGSPNTNVSTALELREEPVLPSARASDAAITVNRGLRFVQQQPQQGHRQERCPTPQQPQLGALVSGHFHQSDEEVASHQQGGRVLSPLRLDNGSEAGTGVANPAPEADTACQAAADIDATVGQDARHCRQFPNSLGGRMGCTEPTISGPAANSVQLSRRLPSTALISRQEVMAHVNGPSFLSASRGPQLPQQLFNAPNVQSTPMRHASPGAAGTMGVGTNMLSSLGANANVPHAQLRQMQFQQQQLQLRQKLQQQVLQQQTETQQQQHAQQQLAPCASISSNLMGTADRASTTGLEAQVRARLGLPPKRNHQASHASLAANTLGIGGSPGITSMGPVATANSSNQIGPELGWGATAAGQSVRMRLMAAAQQSSQTSSPSMSCSASQATVTAPLQLHTSGSTPNEAVSGLAQLRGVKSDLQLGASPTVYPAQLQQRRQHELLMLSQQQRLSVRQALLRSSSPNALSQPGGPTGAPLERACSAPQATLETQIAAARLRKLEQMGISPSQAVLAVAAGGRLPGLQPPLACRTTLGYASAGTSNPQSETGSPMSGRSFKRTAAERCWEEQIQLQQQQQQLELQQQQLQQQQHLQMQGLRGLPEVAADTAGVGRLIGSGVGVGAAAGGGGDALQALKRSRAYDAHELLAPAARGFSSQVSQRFDTATLQTQLQQQHQQQQLRPQTAMMCRSMPEGIHGTAALSQSSSGCFNSFNGGALAGSVNTVMDEMGLPVSLPVPLPSHANDGLRAQGFGGGTAAASVGGFSPLEGPGSGALSGVNGITEGMVMGTVHGGANGLLEGDLGSALCGVGSNRPPGSCGAGSASVDGLGMTPSMGPRCSDAAMDLADLGPEPDYLADTELQSFIAELCAPAGQQDPMTGAAGVAPAGTSMEGMCAQSIAMSETMTAGASGGAPSGEGAMTGASAGPAALVGSAACGGARGPQVAFDEEQRALQTEAEALLNFRFD